MSRSVLCLLLLFVSATASAREARLEGANGDGGGCPEIAAAVAEAEGSSPVKQRATAPTTRAKATKPAGARASESQRVQAPRWHSFLPGMFR